MVLAEVADKVETARNSGIWQTALVWTGDSAGVHPNVAGHTAIAPALTLDRLTQV